jgi:N utilization substance protein B
MPSRHKSRQHALQLLYLWDMRRQPVHEIISSYYESLASEESEPVTERDPFAEDLVRGAVEKVDEIDRLISEQSEHWRLERMAAVDRTILRVAIYELMALPTPSAVVIDQALELARRFSSEESIPFLNGVLDAVGQRLRPLPQ